MREFFGMFGILIFAIGIGLTTAAADIRDPVTPTYVARAEARCAVLNSAWQELRPGNFWAKDAATCRAKDGTLVNVTLDPITEVAK